MSTHYGAITQPFFRRLVDVKASQNIPGRSKSYFLTTNMIICYYVPREKIRFGDIRRRSSRSVLPVGFGSWSGQNRPLMILQSYCWGRKSQQSSILKMCQNWKWRERVLAISERYGGPKTEPQDFKRPEGWMVGKRGTAGFRTVVQVAKDALK